MILFISAPGWSYPCPQIRADDPTAARMVAWLQKFEGVSELPGCRVEITVCEDGLPPALEGPLGELYILESSGREAYLPISMSAGDPKIKTTAHVRDRAFNYIKKDRYRESEFGRTEVYRLEMLTEWEDPSKLKSIDLGTYATLKQLNQPDGNDSRWFNCGE